MLSNLTLVARAIALEVVVRANSYQREPSEGRQDTQIDSRNPSPLLCGEIHPITQMVGFVPVKDETRLFSLC